MKAWKWKLRSWNIICLLGPSELDVDIRYLALHADRLSEEEMELLGKKHSLETMAKDRRCAKE